MPIPVPAYTSGDFSVITAVSLPVFTAPFPGVNIDYILEQDFMVLKVNKIPETLNTPHPDAPQFLLQEEGPERDMGGGIVRWTRKYAPCPLTHNQPGTFAYNFIGFVTGGGQVAIFGRNRFTETVPARIQFDYFLLDEAAGTITDASGTVVYAGTAGVLPGLENVPVLSEQQYYQPGYNTVYARALADEIGYSPDAEDPQVSYPTPFDSLYVSGIPGLDFWLPPAYAYPTREVYEAWINQTQTVKRYTPGATPEDAGTTEDTGIYEMVAQASLVQRWLGNIIERQTIYIRPK